MKGWSCAASAACPSLRRLDNTPMETPVKKPRLLQPLLLVSLWCALPSLFLYCNNAYEVPLTDVLLPLAVSVLSGVLCFFVLRLVVRQPWFAALLSVVCMGLFLNFNFIVALVDALFDGVRVRVYYIAAAVVGAALISALLPLRKKPAISEIIGRLALIAVAVILAINVVTAVPNVIRRLRATSYSASGAADTERTLPNLYYFIVDEYASFSEMKRYYDYDNSEFHDFLTNAGFCVSDNSYNRGGGTIQNMADNMNLGPVATDAMTLAEHTELFNNGTLYGVLEGMGYELYQLGSLYPLPKLLEKTSLLSQSGAATMNGETALEILVTNSMLMPLPTMLYWRRVGASGDMAVFDWLDDPAHYSLKSNRAIFAYACCPHPPFYYDADGNPVDAANWENWSDLSYYRDQYIYITKRMKQTVSTILEHDPRAVILLQSDHGLRYHEDSEKPHTFWIETAYQRQIFNALYVGGEPVDITGLSGYNTWRALLNALGGDYPLLPEE